MTADYNHTEAQGLIAEAREDRSGWNAIAKIKALADQLEAAGREVKRLHSQTYANWSLRQQLDGLQVNLTDARADLTKAKDEHTGDGLAWFEKEHALIIERDSLRQQLEAAQRERSIAFAEREHANDWMARIRPEYERLQADLAAAQRRIAELMEALDDAIQRDDDAAALRAIWPVYRAAGPWREQMVRSNAPSAGYEADDLDGRKHWARGSNCNHRLVQAVDAAKDALTPEILAALGRAGLELP